MNAGIEDVRKFWDNRPCNVRHSTKPVGSAAYCHEVRQRRYFVEPHIPRFAEFNRWHGRSVLEVGCGIGTDGSRFAAAGADYTGTDLSGESLAIAARSFKSLSLRGAFFKVNAEELQDAVPKKAYDLVYSFGVIHHSPHPEAIIDQIRAHYIGPHSELRIMLYSKYSWKNAMIAVGLDQPEAQYGCPIANTYSGEEVSRLLAGFRITQMEKAHIFPYRIREYKEYRYKKAFPWNIVPDSVRMQIARHLGWHWLITARKR